MHVSVSFRLQELITILYIIDDDNTFDLCMLILSWHCAGILQLNNKLKVLLFEK